MQKYDLFCKRKKNWVEKMPSKSDFMTYVNGFERKGGGGAPGSLRWRIRTICEPRGRAPVQLHELFYQ